MSWSVEHNAEIGVVQCTYIGRVTAEEFKKSTIQAIDLAKNHDTNLFLLDDSKWEGGASLVGIFELTDLYLELKVDRRSRAALILPLSGAALEADARFYETVCLNRGWQVKVFPERQEAINWLTNETLSNKPDTGD